MKLAVNKKRLNLNPEAFLRRSGYAFIHDPVTGKDSFVRRFTSDFYPRFHMYFDDLDDRIVFNLHLDQKKASYQNQRAHSAEYEGPAVENEIERLKGFLIEESSAEGSSIDKPEETPDRTFAGIGHADFRDASAVPPEKKGWWKFFS